MKEPLISPPERESLKVALRTVLEQLQMEAKKNATASKVLAWTPEQAIQGTHEFTDLIVEILQESISHKSYQAVRAFIGLLNLKLNAPSADPQQPLADPFNQGTSAAYGDPPWNMR